MTAAGIVDLFGGSGGCAEACRILGLTEVGLEWDQHACRTRAAAGHPVIRTDVALYPTWPFKGRIKGLIDGAPCQAWSRAGKRLGIVDQPLVHQAVADLSKGRDTRETLLASCRDKRSLLAAEPMRWLYDLRPEWTCMEEVPDVLPLWQQYAQVLREWGYSVWCGILNAADYGVAQTRQRAILIASRVREVAPPEPTHAKTAESATLFGAGRARWVSMAEALGWGAARVVNTRGARKTAGGNEFPADDPSWALTEKARSWVVRSSFGEPTKGAHERDPFTEPSHTLTEKTRSWVLRNDNQPGAAIRATDEPAPTMAFGNSAARVEWVLPSGTQTDADTFRITVEEASVLQSFRPDYPWQGSKTAKFLQIGNAAPPRLAAAVIGAATGMDWAAAIEREYGTPEMERAA